MKERVERLADYILLFSLPVSIIGALLKYKLMHGANELLIAGLPSVATGALLKYIPERTMEGYLLGFGIAAGSVLVLFKLVHFSF